MLVLRLAGAIALLTICGITGARSRSGLRRHRLPAEPRLFTLVKAVQFTELRTAIAALSSGPTPAAKYYHTDAIGSVRMITDQTQTIVARYDYAPFGTETTPPAVHERHAATMG